MYDALILSEQSRSILKAIYEPKYPDFIGHHVTLKFAPGKTYVKPLIENAQVVGYCDDGQGCEAFLVSVNGNTIRPDGKFYHITWSIDRSKGVKPVHAGDLLADIDYEVDPIEPWIELNFKHEIVR